MSVTKTSKRGRRPKKDQDDEVSKILDELESESLKEHIELSDHEEAEYQGELDLCDFDDLYEEDTPSRGRGRSQRDPDVDRII